MNYSRQPSVFDPMQTRIISLTCVGLSLIGFGLETKGQNSREPATAPRAAVVQGTGSEAGAPLPTSKTSSIYRLGVADLIAVSVYQEPDLATNARIAEDGTVVLPLLGTVKVAGMSVKEASSTITALYNKDYLVDPVVTISVVDATKGRISVLGAVSRPGTYDIPLEGSLPIIEAISLAGGFSRVANESRITVKRVVAGKEEVIKVNGKDQISSKDTKVFHVQPGDVISVAESLF